MQFWRTACNGSNQPAGHCMWLQRHAWITDARPYSIAFAPTVHRPDPVLGQLQIGRQAGQCCCCNRCMESASGATLPPEAMQEFLPVVCWHSSQFLPIPGSCTPRSSTSMMTAREPSCSLKSLRARFLPRIKGSSPLAGPCSTVELNTCKQFNATWI